ncbi:alpha/beta hydrolase, partial [Pseudomonas sp. RTS2]|nr:alpha/beta hydrolase [Pseudomonas sp. RTS2]
MPFIRTLCVAGLFSVSAAPVLADTYGPELQGFAYPYP